MVSAPVHQGLCHLTGDSVDSLGGSIFNFKLIETCGRSLTASPLGTGHHIEPKRGGSPEFGQAFEGGHIYLSIPGHLLFDIEEN